MKKRKIFLTIICFIIIGIVGVFFTQNSNKNSDNESILSKEKQKKMDELYEYGEKIEKMDILPNTIVAKFNGQEILFHEVESYRNSINYAIENGNKDFEGKSAFYEVVINKLYSYLAKKYPEAVTYGLNIEEQKEKTKKEWYEGTSEENPEEHKKSWLKVLFIEEDEIWLKEDDFVKYLQYRSVEMNLQSKGMSILHDFMIEKPELANDKELENLVNEHLDIREKQIEFVNENKTEDALNLTDRYMNLYKKIQVLYTCDLILNSDLELCVDKGELSTTVPTIYSEN